MEVANTGECEPGGFDFGLFQRVLAEESGGNVVLSPFSARLALAMAYNGASGGTLAAMAETLDLQDASLEEVNARFAELLSYLREADEQVVLEIANSLWGNRQVRFYEDFIGRCRDSYGADVETLDYSDPASAEVINDWVKEKTHEKIERIVDELDPYYGVMTLINALYFNGKWSSRFDPGLTEERDFHFPGGETGKVPMMRQSGEYLYCESRDFQAVSLPYGGGRLSMYVFLPKTDVTYRDFLAGLNELKWEQWMGDFASLEGDIALPRFTVEYEANLNDALKAMGMEPAFQEGFGAMGPEGEGFFLSEVKQKTYIDVNEEGTEAAAVTGVEVELTSAVEGPRFSMVVDRPFFFAIRDNASGALLFMGSIVDPS